MGTAVSGRKGFSAFLILWVGQLISTIGSGLSGFALGIYAFQKTQTATSYSLIILFAFLPAFLLRPIGGTLSDRYDRRLLMIIGDIGSALGLGFILLMMYAGYDAMWIVYAGVALSSIFVALQNPAYKASVTDLLDEEAYGRASGLMQLAESSRFLVAPIVAGFLLGFLDIKSILVIDILTFVAAIAAIAWVRGNAGSAPSTAVPEKFFDELKGGFAFTFAHKGLLWLLVITSLLTFCIGFLQALMGPMMLSFTDAKTLGTSQTIAAAGMLVSSAAIGVFSRMKRQVLILAVSLGCAGVFYALFGVSTSVAFIIVSGFMFFMALPFVNTSLDVLIRKNVDNAIQGRVWSIVSLISQFGMVIAFAVAGVLADSVFNPMLQPGGTLAGSVGLLIGVGPGRGIGLMFVFAGFGVTAIALCLGRIRKIRELEKN